MAETYRVQLNKKTARLLSNLREAFEGGRAMSPDLQARDDVVIARELGWHLRQVEGDWKVFIIQLLEEYIRRLEEANVSGEVFVTPRHVLTRDGITGDTLNEIDRRVTRVRELTVDLDLTLASLTDEELVDLDVWCRLRRLHDKAPVHEERTRYFRWEIEARAKYRSEHKLTASPRVPVQRGFKPLTALERAQFCRVWRRSIPDVDTWTDDDITLAILHGG